MIPRAGLLRHWRLRVHWTEGRTSEEVLTWPLIRWILRVPWTEGKASESLDTEAALNWGQSFWGAISWWWDDPQHPLVTGAIISEFKAPDAGIHGTGGKASEALDDWGALKWGQGHEGGGSRERTEMRVGPLWRSMLGGSLNSYCGQSLWTAKHQVFTELMARPLRYWMQWVHCTVSWSSDAGCRGCTALRAWLMSCHMLTVNWINDTCWKYSAP